MTADAVEVIARYFEWPFAESKAQDVLAALDAAGLVVVPRVPTDEMVFAAFGAWEPSSDNDYIIRREWAAMLSAVPTLAATKPKL